MSSEFITINSKLTVNNNTIWQKRIIEPQKNYWFHSFILFLLGIGYGVYEMVTENPYRWIMVVVLTIWMTRHIITIYQILFINAWRSNIPLSDIKEIRTPDPENEFEEKVVLRLKSGREKTYIFRKSENQAEKFVLMISSQISLLSHVAQ